MDSDTTGRRVLWELIQDLSNHADIGPGGSQSGFEFGTRAMVILLALLVLAILGLCGALLYIFRRWEKGQERGIKALATNRDSTKREITDLLKTELSNARSANAADLAKIELYLNEHRKLVHSILLDLAIIGHKLKLPIRSSPTGQIDDPSARDPKDL